MLSELKMQTAAKDRLIFIIESAKRWNEQARG
jgi:hypothetical protein